MASTADILGELEINYVDKMHRLYSLMALEGREPKYRLVKISESCNDPSEEAAKEPKAQTSFSLAQDSKPSNEFAKLTAGKAAYQVLENEGEAMTRDAIFNVMRGLGHPVVNSRSLGVALSNSDLLKSVTIDGYQKWVISDWTTKPASTDVAPEFE